MHSSLLKISGIVLITLAIFTPIKIHAQQNNQEFRINIFRSKVTRGSTASNSFFNTTVLGIEYQHELIQNLNGVARIRYLQFIGPTNNNISTAEEAVRRFSQSFLTFDFGLSLIPFTIGKSFEIRFSPGASLRHRNQVFPFAAYEFKGLPILVRNRYDSSWDIGGSFNLGFVYIFNSNWLLELRGQFHTYTKGASVFDVGLSFGIKF